MSLSKDSRKKEVDENSENLEPGVEGQETVRLQAEASSEATELEAMKEPTSEVAEPAVKKSETGKKAKKRKEPSKERLLEEKAALEDQLLRLRAEYANFKRRSQREREQLADQIKILIFRDVIPVLDDFKRFFEHVENSEASLDKGFVEGVELIQKTLVKALKKYGVEPIDQTGVPVDYDLHEAMMTEPVEQKSEDHTVKRIIEVGYWIKERKLVIRPAKVVVGVFNQG